MTANPNLTIRYAEIDDEYAARLASTPIDDDGPVWMVNLMSYRDAAEYADGRASTLTGQQADDEYAPFEALAAVGAEIVFVADVDSQLLGDDPHWNRVAVVKYPSGRAFIEMQNSSEFAAKHVHKDAGMDRTIVMGTRPMMTPPLPDDAPDWAEVPHPPTEADPYVVVLHVLRFHDGGADTDMVSYQNAAGAVAVPHGLRIGGWMAVDGTILGDGRSWDQARFNVFPSREAFMAVVFDPDRLAAQSTHRETAIADTYTLILRPFLDRLTESFTS